MTIEEVIGCDADKLCAMTDKELEEHFHHMLNFTRPELVSKEVKSSSSSGTRFTSQRALNSSKKNAAIEKALLHGIDLRGLL